MEMWPCDMYSYNRLLSLSGMFLTFIHAIPCVDFSFLFFNWSIVDLLCCVSFRCTTKWFSYQWIYRIPWCSDEEPTCQCRGYGLDPWSRKIPHVKVTKPVCHDYRACALEPLLCNKRSHHNEKPIHGNWRAAFTLQQRPNATKNKYK